MTQHTRDLRRRPGIKRSYLDLPDTLEGTTCYCVNIPSGVSNKLVLIDLLTMATQWFNWERTEGTDAKQAADAWRDALKLPELNMCCCDEPVRQRYGDDGILEVDYGDGVWVDAPELDPRFNSPTAPPLSTPPGNALRCEAAGNVVGYWRAMADDLIGDAAVWASLTGLIGAIAGIIVVLLSVASAGALTPLLLGLTAALLAVGQTAFDAAMAESVYDTFLCIVYCNTPDDGNYTVEDWQAIKVGILADLTGIAASFLHDGINAAGLAGLTNASRSGIGNEGDCDDCTCNNFCAEKYEIWTNDPIHGEIIEYGENYIIAAPGATGYLTLAAINPNDCCYVTAQETLTGTGELSAFELCGQDQVPPWTPNTPIGNCCSIIEAQFSVWPGTIKIYFDVCPP